MIPNKSILSLLFLFLFQILLAQKPQKPSSVEIYNQIEKLNFLGSVLYIAAHPDDENTRLISYLSNDTKARTGYLSLTRGDGGQNLIGPQLRELLGVIRTQELIEARKIDGGEQFFSRANDFGFSKNPDETLQIWDKEKVLSDVVWAIRKFQPDVIINRFDHRSPGTTHGHHTSSAMLSTESFTKTNDPSVFPDQLKLVDPWQAKRQFFNTSWWFYGSKEKFDAANKSKLATIQTGVYYQNLGKSNQEIAALSRSSHQSQGFGSTGSRGEDTEYLELINGEPLKDNTNIFEGIDTSWNRVKGGKPIGDLLTTIVASYNFSNPSASVPNLVKVYQMIQTLDKNHWKTVKTEELKKIIAACSGLYLEAVAQEQEATPGSTISLKLEAVNRSAVPMQLVSVLTLPEQKSTAQNKDLKNNNVENINLSLQLPVNIDYTQPYWLKEKGTVGMYAVNDQKNIGIPDVIREVKVVFNVAINGVEIPFDRTVVYKYNDNVKGEMYNYLDIVPEVTTSIINKVALFNNANPKAVAVKVKAGKDNIKGDLRLELPKNWIVTPASIPFVLDKKGSEKTVYFDVSPPKEPSEVTAKSIATIDNKAYDTDQVVIDYNHITKQQVLAPAESKFIKMDLKIENLKIAYIMGAGDEVPSSLTQMGYTVILLNPEEISAKKLELFDVVITGIRAYNTVQVLANKQKILFDFVKDGKTMLVQYNTPDLIADVAIAPFPLKISRDRVTEENAKVKFLAPDHRILNYPNKITTTDFEDWTQEQGLYYPSEYDTAFTPILSSHDQGESSKDGAVLVAPYGKGYYIYTGLSFFRELPAGVSGAYRLISNMISLKNPKILPEQK
ncbi:PIG-L family deacetylase [Flavobacterium muglaense]|uniref:PIG-L family deacetylase n=1 Tax=Flavobacterium muglaense TaxID=2764716 RepID=A0A923N053_9FLAO|nr:PIG-L family deacetylase [Flavobacterium muglaense]MBC5838386.1 PIG-L family deacetylase [Flavobacterium muglaense]MBC5844921.1 PIG-L family deacetylase [Flavobacterium muglaense]